MMLESKRASYPVLDFQGENSGKISRPVIMSHCWIKTNRLFFLNRVTLVMLRFKKYLQCISI
jgi:hypothetical protein